MSTPHISIVTPSFNQGEFIGRTIESVLCQEVKRLEYLIMDGASTDSTISVLKSYENRVEWISAPDNGPASAINKGFKRSRGSILGWLNSDDVYYPGALSKVVDFFDANPDIDVVYGQADHIDEDGRVLESYPTEDFDFKRLIQTCFISQPAAFFRRRVFVEQGALSEDLRGMDYDYWLRLARKGVTFAYLKEKLAATRLHAKAFTVAQRLAAHTEVNEMMIRHFGKVPDRWLFNYAHAELEKKGVPAKGFLTYSNRVNLGAMRAALVFNGWISLPMLWTVLKTTAGLRA